MAEVIAQAKEKGITLSGNVVDDVLIVALFQQVGWKFLENRNNPAAFEPAPTGEEVAKPAEKPTASQAPAAKAGEPAVYTVELEAQSLCSESERSAGYYAYRSNSRTYSATTSGASAPASANAEPVKAPMAGNYLKSGSGRRSASIEEMCCSFLKR